MSCSRRVNAIGTKVRRCWWPARCRLPYRWWRSRRLAGIQGRGQGGLANPPASGCGRRCNVTRHRWAGVLCTSDEAWIKGQCSAVCQNRLQRSTSNAQPQARQPQARQPQEGQPQERQPPPRQPQARRLWITLLRHQVQSSPGAGTELSLDLFGRRPVVVHGVLPVADVQVESQSGVGVGIKAFE
jgi:hypothetical protein